MSSQINRIILEDLETITQQSRDDLQKIVNSHVVLTGASGFIGKWLTLSFLHARRELQGSGKMILSCRNSQPLKELLLEANFTDGYSVVESDVRSFPRNVIQDETLLINAATPARESLNLGNPMEMFEIIIQGQRRLLELSAEKKSVRFLFLSSGAVYGKQPLDLVGLPESWERAPDPMNPANSYHEGKRVGELMGSIFLADSSIEFISARLFAFLAPFLPLDEHFAAGNFLRNALHGQNVVIKSGGGSIRSYMYSTDLCSTIWALLTRGQSGSAYNVGSSEETNLRELAEKIRSVVESSIGIDIQGIDTPTNVSRYTPDTSKTNFLMNHPPTKTLMDAIERTSQWAKLADI
jgi:dTDP-glucose 4,6-dehydratase